MGSAINNYQYNLPYYFHDEVSHISGFKLMNKHIDS